MAALLDCEPVSNLQPVDNSLTLHVVLSGITLTKDGVKVPALQATWLVPDNIYVVGVQFEYTDSAGHVQLTEPQNKAQALWQTTAGLIAGATYACRYRTVGPEGLTFGPWSGVSNVTLPIAFTSNDTNNVGEVPAAEVVQLTRVEFPAALVSLGEARDTLYAATTGLVYQTADLFAQLNTPTTGIVARLTTAETRITTNNSAAVTRLNALEATVNTPTTGVTARLAILETAVTTPTTGLVARTSALEVQATGLMGAAASALSFIPSPETWTNSITVGGLPAVRPTPPAAQIVNGTVAPPAGNVNSWGPRPYVRWEAGRIYELTMDVSAPVGNPDSRARFVVPRFDSAYGAIAAVSYIGTGEVIAGQTSTITVRVGLGVTPPGGVGLGNTSNATWISFGVQLNISPAGSQQATSQQTLVRFSYRDVTDAEAAVTLTARTAASETAIVNLQTGKADVSRVALLEARADTLAYGDIFAAYVFRNDALNGWAGFASTATLTAGPSFATLAALTGDPQMVRTGLAIQGSRFTRVVVDIERITNRTNGLWQGQMYWSTSGHGYSGIYSVSGVPDVLLGERRELVFDIETSPTVQGAADWKASTITALRFDFDQGQSGQFRIYSIRVLGPDGARLAASVSTLESAVVNLQTGKADVSLVTEVRAIAARGDTILNPNPNFADWPTGQALPTGYSTWVNGGTFARAAGLNGAPNSLRAASTSAANHGHMTAILNGANAGGEWLVVECEFTLVSGDLRGAGISLQFYDTANVGAKTTESRSFATLPDASSDAGVVRGSGVPGQTYRYKFLIDGRAANVARYRLIQHTRFTTFGNIGAATIDWHRHALRTATPEEVAAKTVLPAVQASVLVLQTATADLYGRTQARWAVGTAVPGATAFMYAEAESTPGGPATSNVAIGARVITLYSASGDQWLRTLSVSGGNVLIEGVLQATVAIRLGNGQGWPIARGAVEFNVADGEVLSFGTDLGAIPQISYAMNNLLPLNVGETYDVRATSPSPTGFTMRAKINIPSTPSAYDRTDPVASTEFGSGGRKIDKTAQPASIDGTYRLQGTLSNRHQFFGTGTFSPDPGFGEFNYAYGEAQVWVRRTGSTVWQMAASFSVETAVDPNGWPQYQYVTVAGSAEFDETLNLGDNVEQVGIRHANHGSPAENAAYFTRMRWTAAGAASGVRSALAAGATTRVTVRPI